MTQEAEPIATEPDEGVDAKRRFEDLPPPAQRALREAEERRAELTAKTDALPKELGGRGGKDPARYDDWEVKGIAIDF